MTDQELRRLSRRDLLELLISQGRERDALQTELEKMKAELKDRRLSIEHAGSIAEAALQVNGVFEAAQAAAQQYLDNIRQRSEQVERVCAEREAETQRKIDRRLREAEQAARQMEAEAKIKAEAYWKDISERLERFYKEHEDIKALLDAGGIK